MYVCLSVTKLKFSGSRRFKKIPEGSRRFQKVPEGSKRFQKVPEGPRRYQRVPEGSRGFQKVPEGSRRFKKVQEGSRRLDKPESEVPSQKPQVLSLMSEAVTIITWATHPPTITFNHEGVLQEKSANSKKVPSTHPAHKMDQVNNENKDMG